MKKILFSTVLKLSLSLCLAGGLSTSATALGFSDLTDAFTGHVSDLTERWNHEDDFIDGTVVATATFRTDDPGRDGVHYVDGTVSVIRSGGALYVQLHEDFEAGLAPDLYLYVSDHVVTHEAELIEFTEVAKLKSGSGAQYYEVPEEFSEVLIWCKRFNEYMGAATVERR